MNEVAQILLEHLPFRPVEPQCIAAMALDLDKPFVSEPGLLQAECLAAAASANLQGADRVPDHVWFPMREFLPRSSGSCKSRSRWRLRNSMSAWRPIQAFETRLVSAKAAISRCSSGVRFTERRCFDGMAV